MVLSIIIISVCILFIYLIYFSFRTLPSGLCGQFWLRIFIWGLFKTYWMCIAHLPRCSYLHDIWKAGKSRWSYTLSAWNGSGYSSPIKGSLQRRYIHIYFFIYSINTKMHLADTKFVNLCVQTNKTFYEFVSFFFLFFFYLITYTQKSICESRNKKHTKICSRYLI